MRAVLALFAAALGACAQTPVQLEFQCTQDDIQLLGQNCSGDEPCPVYLELSSLEVVGPKLFLTGNFHTETSTLASVLLTSADGGKTWTEPHPRIRYAGLDQIQFLDFETGWIGGQILAGTPKDAFLLISSDGGKSWRAQPINEESHPGMIERFWFDSRTSGTLLIDRVQASETGVRHELYESMTGGDNWTLRQAASAPIKLKHFRSEQSNPDWRLRADAPSNTYRLERREAGKWSAVAVFPVRSGQCKEAEPALVEPPPAEPGQADAEADKKPATPVSTRKPPTLRKKRPN